MITSTNQKKIIHIEKEIKKSYLNYAMSVIIGRALPDIRDGLKPVHRRILYAMFKLNNTYNKPYKKSARIVGDVIGKYHPHGDNAVYESIVRMAQNFSLRYPLIDGQGNFGSIDGDSAAAMRYTEIRMSKITQEFLKDIKKDTVYFSYNYDATKKIPEILPTKIPNILINGSTGIAVGMATNIPPHNITEVMNALIACLETKNIKTSTLLKYIKGPDFPTGGIIEKNDEIYKAYKTGKGTLQVKAKIKIEKKNKQNNIVITEIPYQINKKKLIEKILMFIKEKKIEGIKNISDESNKEGMRIVIQLKKNTNINLTINKLFLLTNLKISYGINIVALYKKKPKIFNLKQILKIFIKYRKRIIIKKTIYNIYQLKKKIHIFEGFLITIYNIDKILKIIKTSSTKLTAKKILLKKKWILNKNFNYFIKKTHKYKLSEKQTKSILNLSLSKLTKIEQNKIIIKYKKYIKKITKLQKIIKEKKTLKKILKEEFENTRKIFGDKRHTKIIKVSKPNIITNLIKKEKVLIILTKNNYIHTQLISEYDIQHKGGKGKLAIKMQSNDVVKKILITNTHSDILLFSNIGRLFFITTYKLPLQKRTTKGKPLINYINLNKKETISIIIATKKEKIKNKKILIITKKGIIKKIKGKEINIKRNVGLNLIHLKKHDVLKDVQIIDKQKEIMLFTKLGKTTRFLIKDIRNTKRTSLGITGIKLSNHDKVISLITFKNIKDHIIIVTKNGYGKITPLKEFPRKSRATKGLIFIKINKKNGSVVKINKLNFNKKNQQIILITNLGNLMRILIKEINILKRNTQGIILIRMNNTVEEKIADIQNI